MSSLNTAFIKAYRKIEAKAAQPAVLPMPHFAAGRVEKPAVKVGAETARPQVVGQLAVVGTETTTAHACRARQ